VGVWADAAEGAEGLVEDLVAVGDEEDAVVPDAVEGAQPGLPQAGCQDHEPGAVAGLSGGLELAQGLLLNGAGFGWRLHLLGWCDARCRLVASVVPANPVFIEGRGGRVAEELLEGIGHRGEAGLIP